MTTKLPLLVCALLALSPLHATAQDNVAAVLAGMGVGGGQMRTLSAADGTVLDTAAPFGPSFNGGVRVAAGDINGDGVDDFIAGSGHGAGQVTVLSGEDLSVLWAFTPFGPSYNGGVYVASGDIDGDTRDDVIVGAGMGSGGGGQVRVYSGATHRLLVTRTPFGPSYHGGVTVAAGDINGDTRADLVTGTAIGGTARVLDGVTGATVMTILPYGNFNGGVNVAAGDVNGDGRTDVITGPGGGGNVRQVKAFSGFGASLLVSFTPYPTGPPTGVYVAAGKVDGDTHVDIITGPGNGQQPRVKIFSGLTLSEISSFLAFAANFHGGVFVAAVREDHGGPEFTSDDNTTFHVGDFGTFTVTTSFSSTPTLSSSGTLPSGVTFTDNLDGTATLEGIPADGTGGVYPLTFTADDGVNPPVTQSFTLTVQEVPEITSANSTTFLVGSPGNFTVTTDGYPDASIAIGGDTLPDGVGFDDNGDGSGTLSGTPAAGSGGIYNLTFTASNAKGTGATQNFTLTVEEAPVITSASAVTFTVGQAGSFTVTTNGFPDPSIAQGGAALPANVTFVSNGDGTGTLSGTPQAGTGGTYAINFTATNSVGSSPMQNFTLTVQDAPVITSANSTTFMIGQSGTFTVTSTGFPTNTLTQGADTLPLNVTFDDNDDNTGTLSGTPQAKTAGVYHLTFTAANDVPPDAVQNFTLTVACPAINVTPTGPLPDGLFGVTYPSQNFMQSGGNGTITWSVTGAAGLTIDAFGVLSGTPDDTQINGAVVVTATDAFGCSGTSNEVTLTVRPTTDNETYEDGVGNTEFVVKASAMAPVPATPHVSVIDNVKIGDAGPAPLSVIFDPTSAFLGTIVEGSTDGTFRYTPAAGFAGSSDSFSYTLTDGNGVTNTGMVTINLSGLIWYVNNTGGNGDGRSHNPFDNLASAGAASSSNQHIYVHSTDENLTDNLALDANQTLHGQGATFTFNALTISAGAPSTLAGTVMLNNNTLVRAVNFATSGIPALTGTGMTLAADIDLVNTTGGSNALSLTNVSGPVSVTNSSFTNATGAEVLINGGNGAATIGAVISSTAAGSAVDVQNRTGGTVTFTGSITDTGGTGILVNSNTASSTTTFAGGLSLATGGNAAFTATNGGTVNVCALAGCVGGPVINTLATTTATALNVSGTNIGASGLTFRSISAGTGAGSGGNGIVLDGTGVSAGNGGVTVTGNGAAGTGGTIQHKTGANASLTAGIGIYLNNTKNASFNWMQLNDFDNFAIRANEVVGLALGNIVVNGSNGNSAGDDEGAILLEDTGGAVAITNTNVSGGYEDDLRVLYDNPVAGPPAVFNVNGSTFRDLQATGNSMVQLRSTTAAAAGWNVSFDFSGSTFENDANTLPPGGGTENFGDGILVTFEGPFQHALSVQGSNFHHLFQGLDIASNFSADVNYTVKDNAITFTDGVAAIAIGSGSSSTSSSFLTGLIQDNDIGTSGVPQSGNRLGMGIIFDMRGNEIAQFTVHGNTIRRTEVNGIRVLGQAADGKLDIQLTNNVIDEIEDDAGGGTSPVYGMEITTNNPASYDICLDARNNNSFNLNAHDIRVRQGSINVTFDIAGLTGSGTVAANVEAFLATQNPGNTTNVRTGGSVVNYTSVGSCTTPPIQ